ncbi:hypothetical protein RM533_07975 [Croceicoccus sp. F390]|uniref:Uncharacterized protein n=1 Tax=Croceicoccus esteveae TaxID=3075597 RepID=A0ABU2ZJB8_9SPHN|nr:hypothetical protein [Croceicoccus sp. F390]MDT0576123.1 hypothetical protein [Croceicoccus sp. F390]
MAQGISRQRNCWHGGNDGNNATSWVCRPGDFLVAVARMKAVLGWFGRRAMLYLLLVVAIGAATFMLPWLRSEWAAAGAAQRNVQALEIALREVRAGQSAAQARLDRDAARFRSLSQAQLGQEIARRQKQRQAAQATLSNTGPLARIDPRAIVTRKQTELEIAVLDQEIAALAAARDALQAGMLRNRAQAAFEAAGPAPSEEATLALERRCDTARAALRRYKARQWIDEQLRELLTEEGTQLAQQERQSCSAARTARNRRDIAAAYHKAQERHAAAQAWTAGSVKDVTADIEQRLAQERANASNSLRARSVAEAERLQLPAILKAAAFALLLIIVTPYAIRLLFWFVLAPIAERRGAIRLDVEGGAGKAILPAPVSQPSVAIRLAQEEYLLVRQDYLQTSSQHGVKQTQWLLDRHHLFSSIASGMTFLTRISGEGDVTTISALHDPFAEVTIVTLPRGAACVLHPRALAAVVQQQRWRMRITSHWRLFSLNAWLTMQLRFLVFHGPGRLVVKGSRGVRVEQAERGRIFAQDQLVGFSTDLAYSVTRTETFWPYFLGRQSLLKDRVEAGNGILIIEEAPLAGRRGSGLRHGLEGAVDAMLKTVGL